MNSIFDNDNIDIFYYQESLNNNASGEESEIINDTVKMYLLIKNKI